MNISLLREKYDKGLSHVNWRVIGIGLFLLTLFIVGFGLVQYGTAGLAGNDGYYHMKMG